ncbi:DUF1433 domain-containing protein [Bacillus haynesii]|nr:DUF1433 domain-containing protein [Bacillus haynesii]MCY8048561.1 DUF1433 domain-containing protein [Bacillus haynesii]MCY8081418.1 DUF1433 domain-containing protein [Bacillus haynesii]MCY8385309.1 DUF1433 domain-containing protein [Bacillus haynesii]MCY8590909.1 DUF1433 domain-containing protein [Bacillus haynesii]MCY9264685.1 DUF1433 domain-containing protein [Bacillus haynesii]
MKKAKNFLIPGLLLFLITINMIYVLHEKTDQPKQKEDMSEQEKAEQYAEKMKPKIEEKLKKQDIHHFIKTITFEDNIEINPMGRIIVSGYVNNNPEKFDFTADLIYGSNKVDTMGYSQELGDRFTDWSEYTEKEKEEYIKTAYPDKKEREQYLKDIGEKE